MWTKLYVIFDYKKINYESKIIKRWIFWYFSRQITFLNQARSYGNDWYDVFEKCDSVNKTFYWNWTK